MELKSNCLIADIPYPGLREVAIDRLRKFNAEWDIHVKTVYSLPWVGTPEGSSFWRDVYLGIYDGRFEKPTLKRI